MHCVASWPKTIYFSLQPKSDSGLVFPLKTYPSKVPPNDPVKIGVLRLDTFASDKYRLFYTNSTPSQFGRANKRRVTTQVVFATDEQSKWLLDHGAVELEKRDNPILCLRDESSSGTVLFYDILIHRS